MEEGTPAVAGEERRKARKKEDCLICSSSGRRREVKKACWSHGKPSAHPSPPFSHPSSSLSLPLPLPLTTTRPLSISLFHHHHHLLKPPQHRHLCHQPTPSSYAAPPPPFPDLEEAFESARTTDAILSTFHALEPHLPPSSPDLALACLKVGQYLDSTSHPDLDLALSFSLRALSLLELHSRSLPLPLAMSRHLLGSLYLSLHRFRHSLHYLNRANSILHSLSASPTPEFDAKPVQHAVELQLANTKIAMGRREEAILNLRNCLQLKESISDPRSREVGVAYRELAEAYVTVLNFKEALALCSKALEIHEELLGRNSTEVAHDRRLLAIVYSGLDEHQKALEQNQLSRKVMKGWGLESDIVNAEIEAANMQIVMGRYEEAIRTLGNAVQEVEKDSHMRALVFITMAKALGSQEKPVDVKRCLEIACGILENREGEDLQEAAEGYADMAEIYENLNEFEPAIMLLKRAVTLFERLPQEQYAEANASARIGWLLLLTGKVQEGVPYLESTAERLKESFGPNLYAVGYIYNNLGAVYMELERPQSAAQMFTLAKDVMDMALGKHHADSIGACQNLVTAYDAMGNFDIALEFQKQVVDAWEKHGPSGAENLQVAKRRVEEIDKKITKQLLDAWEGEITKLKEKHAGAHQLGAMPQGAQEAPPYKINNPFQTI